MNLRFELQGITLSMPILKRGRRLGSCMGTDEAVPSKATGSWEGSLQLSFSVSDFQCFDGSLLLTRPQDWSQLNQRGVATRRRRTRINKKLL